MDERSDEQLILASGRGDRDSFGLLVERYHRGVMHFIDRFLGDAGSQAVEDLAQDVFLGAWRASARFEPRAKVQTWLFQIAAHRCLNYRRGMRLRHARSLDADGALEPIDAKSESADLPLERREDALLVRSAVGDLPSQQRAAILLRYFHDFSYAQIADVLDMSISAVESLLFRARNKLRESFVKNRTKTSQGRLDSRAKHY